MFWELHEPKAIVSMVCADISLAERVDAHKQTKRTKKVLIFALLAFFDSGNTNP